MVDGNWIKVGQTRAMTRSAPSRRPCPGDTGRSAVDLSIRILDVIISVVALIFFAPIMAVVAILVYLQDGGSAVFMHRRIGLGGQTFDCLKFRSMVSNAEEQLQRLLATDPVARLEWETEQKLRNDPRVTALGRLLRKSSLDELPQLVNVLRGEMTLVGPRPIVNSEIVRYGRSFRHYCAVKPGITGLWQINGRSELNYSRRVALDIAFAKNKSLGLYLKVLIATVPCVLLRKGAH
jgi:exopolysaccharide production protein ExoY